MRILVLILSHIHIQSNLVNSGREHLFRIISSSNNMKIDIKYIYPPPKKKKNIIRYFSIKHKYWARKRNASMRRIIYAPKNR